MFCGSCMHDNALARALRARGVDCVLQPIYTPIRTDEVSVARSQVFFGGVHVFLLQQMPWLRWVPRRLRGMLDWPPLIRLATRQARSTDPAQLGDLAISMLRGADGQQREEVERLVHWLADSMQPDVIVLSNLLIGGSLPEIRRRLPEARLIVLLQGDDIFLDHLPETAKAEAIRLCGKLANEVDAIVVNSRFYAAKMGALLGIDAARFTTTPLSIDTSLFETMAGDARPAAGKEFRIGYLARIAPEKGLHRLVEAFIELAGRTGNEAMTLHVAGWLGETNRDYLAMLIERIEAAGLIDRFAYHGSPSLAEKIEFLRSLDVLSVPTEYEEPKGLFVLEALAAGVPVVQPDHGAFGELIESTGGGLLVSPGSIEELGAAIERLKDDPQLRQQCAQRGQRAVLEKHSIGQAAEQLQRLFVAPR